MQNFMPFRGLSSKKTYSHQGEKEAVIKRRGEMIRTQTNHARLPWRMKVDGRNRAWIVDAQGVNVHMNPGNIRLILRALEAYGDGDED